MTHRTVRRMLGMAVLLAFVTTAFAQGMYWESKTTGGPLSESVTKNYAVPKKFKHESEGETVIIRLDKEMIMLVDPAKKEYSEMTFAEMEQMMKKMRGTMDAKMAEMQKQMASMPEEQRKMMEKMMGGGMPGMKKDAKIEVKNVGEKKTISGYPCSKVVIKEDEKEMMTLWVTKDVKEFDPLRNDWKEFSKRMMALNPSAKGIAEGMAKVEGFPIQTEMGFTTTVTKIERRPVAASEFEVPAGYTKVKPKLMEDVEGME